MRKTAKQANNSINNETEKRKVELSTAKTEAALKDFELKITPADVEQMVVGKRMGLSQDEILSINEPLDKALLEIVNDNEKISKEKYAETIVNKIIDHYKAKNVPEEKLVQYKNFMHRNCHKKFDRKEEFSKTQLEGLEQKTNKLVDFYKNKFKELEVERKSIQELKNIGVTNPEIINALLPAISKLPPKKMTEQGSKIVKDFAPLLENSNPAFVNGAKKALTELDPKYLAEAGETIAQKLQRVAKPKIWPRIAKVFTGTDYAQKNIDKAINSLKEESKKLTVF